MSLSDFLQLKTMADETFKQDFLEAHNAYRALHGKEAVEAWYSEIKDYNFAKPGFQSGTGHFTQVVWKNSTELGVGMATDGKSVFVVGQYHPAGNFTNKGEFEGNVLPKSNLT
ncbi:Golgi-associated plant pathogenesis-related protein 1 [Oryzias melastigma]|uniref:Golgi-associated plant pathogenesis-related protein 1 n=1 Tax=Oryzias melastigma TaxID=30732 RepID=A0A834CL83_ORYME|nr:Golgi-associated plant pathogenesis-related protein 1 [Oryzias melastigma]